MDSAPESRINDPYVRSSNTELSRREQFYELFQNVPIAKNELMSNLGLFIKRQDLSRIVFMHELYQKIIDIHGVIIEFGVRWGQNLALLESFRGMYEPFNLSRKIIGFDTFAGFVNVSEKDKNAISVKEGDYGVSENYEDYLDQVLAYHESESPIAHIKKYELRKGDGTIEIEKYLAENPETIIAFAYFDFDIYTPTKKCLEAIRPHLTKGSILAFDELNCHQFPGETLALREVFGLDRFRIRRSPISSFVSYIVIE